MNETIMWIVVGFSAWSIYVIAWCDVPRWIAFVEREGQKWDYAWRNFQ